MILKSFTCEPNTDLSNWVDPITGVETPQTDAEAFSALWTMRIGKGALCAAVPLHGTTEVITFPDGTTETQLNMWSAEVAAALAEMAVNLPIFVATL